MAYEIIIKKKFANKLLQILDYLQMEWGAKVAKTFFDKVYARIRALQFHPFLGSLTSLKNVRSTLITKHNRLYYRVAKNKIEILNLYDTRSVNNR